ncbi:class F sortase [Rossellomorea aquimaris]|uniref:class F sortase n=1 Tax=Rossellomorea aquimaris TaxID=189382 RepID=UPI001CD58CAA|nr:class F sortase [Rossellomorea aquimaris]MCA1055646.1 class F sortase [Rossellomorea aquimaris]
MRLLLTISLMALLAGCSAEEPQSFEKIKEASVIQPVQPVKNSDRQASSSEGIIPTALSIPALDLEASVKEFGLDEEGNMELPKNGEDVAWFGPGTEPGESGNAVLAAHVDNEKAPAVFFRLKELNKGDEIHVRDEEGTELTFVVKEKVAYQKDDAPMREIFGPTDKRRLNLITCTGYFDREMHNYVERLVVYTELKDQQHET